MIPMFLVRSRAALAAGEASGAAAYRRQECERDLRGAVRRLGAGCCLHSHRVNMPGKERICEKKVFVTTPPARIK